LGKIHNLPGMDNFQPWKIESAMKKKKQRKKTKGDPKTGQEEESHTCCGCRFPLLFALLQLALGVSVTVLGFLMASISSSLLVRDTPYWAGIIVCVVALVGFVMLCISYQPDEKTCVQFTVKKCGCKCLPAHLHDWG
uniref:Sarcospan n=1 Tax=Strigops habroptila TaxID=2489341 RepID=A0A672UQF3_STRHB